MTIACIQTVKNHKATIGQAKFQYPTSGYRRFRTVYNNMPYNTACGYSIPQPTQKSSFSENGKWSPLMTSSSCKIRQRHNHSQIRRRLFAEPMQEQQQQQQQHSPSPPHQTFPCPSMGYSIGWSFQPHDNDSYQYKTEIPKSQHQCNDYESMTSPENDENVNKNVSNIDPKGSLLKARPRNIMKDRHQERVVKFSPKVLVKEIRSHRDYSQKTKRLIWSSMRELLMNARRNVIEFRAEGRDWRRATEENDMWIDRTSGQLVHPIHVPPHVMKYYHNKQQQQQEVYCR